MTPDQNRAEQLQEREDLEMPSDCYVRAIPCSELKCLQLRRSCR